MKIISLHVVFGVLWWNLASAEVRPNSLFSDHAVLQQSAEVPVWGTARDGESVTVEFQNQKVTIIANNGTWMVRFKNLKPGGPFIMSLQGDNQIVLKDLLVGEVWLCTGQSNMEWALAKSDGGAEAVANANNPMLRMCRVPHNPQLTPQSEMNVKWEEINPTTAKYFSAIPYWFGEKIQKEIGVPVGIINSAYGGTGIEAWLSAETLKRGPWPQNKWTDPTLAKAEYDQRAESARPLKEKYEADKASARDQKLPSPPMPSGLVGEFKGVTTVWNSEVAPMLNYRIRAVAWYQGESNAYVGVASTYKDLLPALIKEWRAGFNQPDLPFLIFQIARNRKWQTDPNEKSGNAELQEAQLKTALTTPHTALVVTNDMGGPDVHYTGKEPVAVRATKAALSLVYGREISSSSPIYQSVEFLANQAIVHFTHIDGGLDAREGELTGFVIAGKDQKFVFAEAKIEGDTVIVSSSDVPEPTAVRYGWADLPKVNLFNKSGFPASPFRTDSWSINQTSPPK